MAGLLYVVATPIGNLDDLSRRAERALSESELVVAEDTRRTRTLLVHLGLDRPLRRIDANATERDLEPVLERLAAGATIAAVTDAGTPVVSDPGSFLVAAARARGAQIVPIPGASAVTTALSASGYSIGSFRFLGFLPRQGLERTRAVAALASSPEAVVLFEAPHRMADTLSELAQSSPGRRALVARELTKLHEELLEGALCDLAERCAGREWLGELTIVLAPHEPETVRIADDELDRRIDEALAAGMRPRDVAERVALESGLSKRDVYQRVLARRDRSDGA
jgi:16S rRNA (cytidine1402-2'-O)-methyltransferase